MDENKLKSLNDAIAQIKKSFGEGAIMSMEDENVPQIPKISSGIFSLDNILGGGYPCGRIVEIYGPESSGKTTIALKAIASAQSLGHVCAFIDAEHALDMTYAKALGVKTKEILLSQPDSGEMALEIAEMLIRSGSVGMIVIDSVAALVPRAELEGEMGDANIGLHARLMSKAMRKLTGIISHSNCIVIFINQIREKVGVSYGNPEVTTGGRALKFYASVRLEVRKKDTLKSGTEMVGNKTRVKTVKNKIYPPFKTAEFDIIFGLGPDEIGEIIDLGIEKELIIKSGAWFSFNEKKYHGREDLRNFFKDAGKEEFQNLKKEIEEKIREEK